MPRACYALLGEVVEEQGEGGDPVPAFESFGKAFVVAS